VGDATRGKIPALLPPGSIDAATRLVLVNALYLKGAWLNPFDPDATADATFHAPAGDVTVPFLNGIHDSARNSTSRSMDIVELPLVGDALSLAIIPLDSVVGDLDFATLGDELALLDEQPVTPVQMSLPKFTVRVATDLVPALQSLGVSDLFGPADLSGINATADLAVTGAFHETFFALDEKGIEAAAATAIVVEDTSVPPPPVSVVVDGPFVFVLRDRATNTPLFVGTIVDPSGS
jgi:serpin B